VIAAGLAVVLRAPWGEASLFSLAAVALCLCVAAFVIFERPTDVLSPAKLASLLYGISFAIGPLLLGSLASYSIPYFGFSVPTLLANAAAITIVGFMFFLAGYLLTQQLPRKHPPKAGEQWWIAPRQRRFMIFAGTAFSAFGAACYVVLIAKAGGLSYFLSYTAGRADIFRGIFGGWFWGTILLFPGYALVALPQIRQNPWACLVASLALGALFFPFQGRDLVVAPVFCWLTLYHYANRRLTWRQIALGALALVILSAFIGAYRSNSRNDIRGDAGQLVSAFIDDIGNQVLKVVTQNVEQLDSVAIAARYVEKTGKHLGGMGLLIWIEPIDRQLLGDVIDSIETGRFMDLLLFPQHYGWNTALSPSLPGELFICLGWLGVMLGMFLYGSSIAILTRWVDSRWSSPIVFAAYPFVSFMLIKMIVDGTGQLFRILIVLSSIFLCAALAPKYGLRHE
jgi:hypothetical protein